MDQSQENVAEEVLPQEVVPPQENQPSEDSSASTPKVSSPTNEEKSKEYNFRQMRETLAQRDEELKQLREQQIRSSEEELGEEDLVEGKHLKKGLSEIREMLRQKDLEAVPDKLRNRFEDFDQVVNQENLEKLKDTEPELYLTLRSGNGEKLEGAELFTKGIAAYKTLKSMGYAPENKDYMKQKEQAHSNHHKPLSTQAIKGAGALHEANVFANGLTPDLKKKLQKEMAEAVKAR